MRRPLTALSLLALLSCGALALGHASALRAQHASPPEALATGDEREGDPKIALLLPLQGDLEGVSAQIIATAELAAQGASLRLEVISSGEDEAQAAEALALAYHDEEVIAVIGPLGLTSSRRVAATLASHPIATFTLQSDESLDGISPYLFRARPSPEAYARAIAEEARRRRGIERVAILIPDHDYGRRSAVAFAEAFVDLGGELSAVVPYQSKTKDLREPLKALSGQSAYVGRARRRVGKRRADSHGFVSVGRKKTIDFEALFLPEYHPTVAKLLPLLPVAGMQSGAGEGSGVAVTLLGMPSWQGASMGVTEAHAAGALYYDPFGGEQSGGAAEAFTLQFESETGRTPVDLEAEVFDLVHLIGALIHRGARASSASGTALNLQRRRDLIATSLPSPALPWRGVCGDWAYGEQGALRRELRLFEFDTDGEVMPLD